MIASSDKINLFCCELGAKSAAYFILVVDAIFSAFIIGLSLLWGNILAFYFMIATFTLLIAVAACLNFKDRLWLPKGFYIFRYILAIGYLYPVIYFFNDMLKGKPKDCYDSCYLYDLVYFVWGLSAGMVVWLVISSRIFQKCVEVIENEHNMKDNVGGLALMTA
jgi:hypothetical protein